MVALSTPPSLLDRLPQVRGRYEPDGAIARYTWFRVGGPAEVLFARPMSLIWRIFWPTNPTMCP